MRRISWISSTVLATPGASFTAGVLSVIIRPKQLKDYTVTHHVGTGTLARPSSAARQVFFISVERCRRTVRRDSSPFQTRKEEQCPARNHTRSEDHPRPGATACIISKPGRKKW